jgi:hypothetical protein
MSTQTAQSLLNDLKRYGLNPTQWKPERIAGNRFLVRHRKDLNYCFSGLVRRYQGQLRWQSLELAGL